MGTEIKPNDRVRMRGGDRVTPRNAQGIVVEVHEDEFLIDAVRLYRGKPEWTGWYKRDEFTPIGGA